MFEKEAEDNKPHYACCAFNTGCELWKDGFQKGAEFGYNKANEWHYVKDGEYPEKGKEILLYTKTLGLIFGEFCEGYKNLWTSNRCDFTTEEIIAWIEKEKILPKEGEFKSEMFPEIILPKGSSEFIDKVIADAEKRVKESE